MAKEIERKFLVSGQQWRSAANSGDALIQAYLCASDDRNLRVRIFNDSRARITIKIGTSAISRDEFEYDIPVDDARDMLPHHLGTIIAKTRYRIPHGSFVWEIDVYHGDLDGLVTAEVEMASESDEPDLPAWLGREVTGDFAFSNQSMALHGKPKEI